MEPSSFSDLAGDLQGAARLFDRAFSVMLQPGVDWADVYLQETRSRNWILEEGVLKSGHFSLDRGLGVRAVSGEKSALAYSNEISEASVLRSARTVAAMGRQGESGRAPLWRAAPFEPRHPQKAGFPEAFRERALLVETERFARSLDPRISDVTVTLQSETDCVLVARADGEILTEVRPLSYLSVTLSVSGGGRRERSSSGGGSRLGMDFFTPERVQGWVRTAYEEASQNLRASPAPAGQMPVVLGPGWPGILLHESVGHGLEGDFIRKGTSVFSERLGERVASPGVTVVDDGTLWGRRGSLSFDDEGTPTRRTALIEEGVLTGFMHDLTSARLLGLPPSGNGRRESFSAPPLPRMTNTFMLPGPWHPEEIVASVGRGIYAANFSDGQVDITNGQFVFNMSRAWMIEKGRLTRPVRGAMLIGSGAEALRHIPMVGSDLRLDEGAGQCGKDGQLVPVGVGMPTVRIDALTVGGTDLARI